MVGKFNVNYLCIYVIWVKMKEVLGNSIKSDQLKTEINYGSLL